MTTTSDRVTDDQIVQAIATLERAIYEHGSRGDTYDIADRIKRADYWSDIRSIEADLRAEIACGNVETDGEAQEWLEQTVDGHGRRDGWRVSELGGARLHGDARRRAGADRRSRLSLRD